MHDNPPLPLQDVSWPSVTLQPRQEQRPASVSLALILCSVGGALQLAATLTKLFLVWRFGQVGLSAAASVLPPAITAGGALWLAIGLSRASPLAQRSGLWAPLLATGLYLAQLLLSGAVVFSAGTRELLALGIDYLFYAGPFFGVALALRRQTADAYFGSAASEPAAAHG